MDIAFGTEQGIRRSLNGDACLSETVAPNAVFFGVADGFGATGQEHPTALHALKLVCEYLRARKRLERIALEADAASSGESLRGFLLAALDHANARLYEAGKSTEDFVGSGASVTAVLIVGRRAFVGHIGDARAYLLRFARLEALTADDVVFTDARGVAGKLKSSSAPAPSRARGLLWRSLGTQEKLEAGIAHVDLLAGDRIILCTDGIHGCISAGEICGVMLELEKSCEVAARLLAMMKMRGGVDNGTVIVGRDLTAFEPSIAVRGKKRFVGRSLFLVGAALLFALVLLFIVFRG